VPKLTIDHFDGLVPRLNPTLLEQGQAQQADNVKLYSGALRAWRGPVLTFSPANTDTIQTIYHYYTDGPAYWLTWETDVDVALSPIVGDVDYRLYYTGDGPPKQTNKDMVAAGAPGEPDPQGSLPMGVPTPTSPLVATAVGTGSGIIETRVYVYTYISTFGVVSQESAPSPPSNFVDVQPGQTVQLTGFDGGTPPDPGYNVTGMRVYRSVAGGTTDSYLFVEEIPISTTTYIDDAEPGELGEPMTTEGWIPPPEDLLGLVTHPNGFFAGFIGSTIYFSVPYYPHAWPIGYAIAVEDDIIGLKVFGASIVVMTNRWPYILNGVDPAQMAVERVPIIQPCVSKRSIASDEYGVLYASPEGMVGIGPSMRGVITGALFRRDEWQQQLPSLMAGAVYDGRYFATYPTTPLRNKAMVIGRDDPPALSNISFRASAVHVDSYTGRLHYVDPVDNLIYELDFNVNAPLNYEWMSKAFPLPYGMTFSAFRLDALYSELGDLADYEAMRADIIAYNESMFDSPGGLMGALNEVQVNTFDVNGSILKNLPPAGSTKQVQVLFFGDGILSSSHNLTSLDPVRIAPFRARELEVKIVGNVEVTALEIATTVMELRSG
jgi:hypothetical protein